MSQTGFIYILTNPSFPQYVKIGYADNVESRLKINKNMQGQRNSMLSDVTAILYIYI